MNGKITQYETKRGLTCLGVRAKNDGWEGNLIGLDEEN
jgi:hypothetical protein